jgi:hypothetical protein
MAEGPVETERIALSLQKRARFRELQELQQARMARAAAAQRMK